VEIIESNLQEGKDQRKRKGDETKRRGRPKKARLTVANQSTLIKCFKIKQNEENMEIKNQQTNNNSKQ